MIAKVNEKPLYSKTLLVLSFLTIVGILLLSFLSFYSAGDDYCYINDLKKNGVFNNALIGYTTWDGRFLTPAAFLQGFLLLRFKVEWIVFIWSCCFIISGFLIFYILKLELKIKNLSLGKSILLMFILAIIFWLGSLSHVSQTIYWATGGVYSFNLLIGSIWLLGFLKFQKEIVRPIFTFAFLLFSIIAGATTINLTIALLTLVLVTILIDFLSENNTKIKLNILMLISICLGLIVILFAPGNFVRANVINTSTSLDSSLFSNYLSVLLLYLKWFSVLFFLSFLGGIILSFLVNPETKISVNPVSFSIKTKQNCARVLINFKWLLVALSTITPFITLPTVASPRTVIYFMYFCLIYIVIRVFKALENDNINNKKNIVFSKNNISLLLISLLLIGSFLFIGYNFEKGTELKKAITARENLLKKSQNKTVVLKLIDPKLNSFCFRYADFDESNDWVKQSVEKYFKTKIIIVK